MKQRTQDVVVDRLCNEIKTHPRREQLLALIYEQQMDQQTDRSIPSTK